MTVIDTNTLSEMLKPEPAAAVVDWFAAQERGDLFITTITLAELFFGVELLPGGQRRMRVHALARQTVSEDFEGRILSFNESALSLYAIIAAVRRLSGRPIAPFDAMIAAIARSREALVTKRNLKIFVDCGVRVINPWDSSRSGTGDAAFERGRKEQSLDESSPWLPDSPMKVPGHVQPLQRNPARQGTVAGCRAR